MSRIERPSPSFFWQPFLIAILVTMPGLQLDQRQALPADPQKPATESEATPVSSITASFEIHSASSQFF